MTRMESAQNRSRLREMYSGPKVDDAFSRFDVLERNADKVDAELEALKASLAKRTNGGEAAKKGE